MGLLNSRLILWTIFFVQHSINEFVQLYSAAVDVAIAMIDSKVSCQA